jgi:4-amino-4-deoxy-L-arabinose transferase-like glycosyltransferase
MNQLEEATRSKNPAVPAARTSFPSVLGIILFWALIYLPGLAWPPMMDDADSEHAVIAREMLQRHDYVTMHVNGVRYLDKAPLPYWITALAYKLFGVSEFTARLPLTLFALFCFLAVYALGREINGEKTGFYSALVLTTTIGPYIYTRFTIPDIMVCFWLTVTVLLFLRTLKQAEPSRALCWSIALATALDVLTKGLIGLVFPVLIIGAYLLVTGNLRHLLRMRLLSSAAVFLAVAAPWHVLITLRNPAAGESKGFFWFYFINEQLYRYLNKRIPHDYDKVPLLIFWGLILVWLIPWSLFVLASLKEVPLRRSPWRNVLGEQDRAALLMAVWALAVLVFFSFSSRQEYYVLPALPGLAVLCGMWLAREANSLPGSSERRVGIRCSQCLLGLGLVGLVIGGYFIATSPTPPPGTDIAGLLESAPTYKLSMGHLFDLTGRAMGLFRWPLALAAGGLFAGTLANWRFRVSGSPGLGNLSLAGMMVVLFYAIHLSLGIFNPVIGSKGLAIAIGKVYRPGDTIVVDGPQSRASSILFYTGVPLHMLNSREGSDLWYGSLFPDSPAVFEDDASFARLWLGPGRVFFVLPKKIGIVKLQAFGKPYYLVKSAGGKSVFTNQSLVASAN